MPFLQDLIQQSMNDIMQQERFAAQIGKPRGSAYASFFPSTEVNSPQHVVPNARTVAQVGFKSNEFAYSIIGRRARAKAQAKLQVKLENGTKSDDDQPDHPLLKLIRKPNKAPFMSERMFWQVKQICQDIAGFAAFEVEYNNLGEPIGLWYMTPHFCSFLRGQKDPLRAIRYQPYGLPSEDIPFIDDDGKVKILFFSNGEDFDPLYPGVKFFSPLMASLPQVQVDNAMTFFLNDFMKNGAKFAGLISVAQTIDETQAEDYRRRWRAQHGGAENWADPLILGEGATYTSMQMNFKDMAFPDLDARTESRICNSFLIDPIVAGAKTGMDVSSFNNKEQAHKAWHYEWVVPSWRDDADVMTNQMLGAYGNEDGRLYCDFDISEVYSLREDRDAQSKRAVELYNAKVAKLNEAREEVGFDPVDEGDEFKADPIKPGFDEEGKPLPVPLEKGKPKPKEKTQAENDAEEAEVKDFRAFAKRRIKEGKAGDIPLFEFKHVDADKAAELVRAATGEAVMSKLEAVING